MHDIMDLNSGDDPLHLMTSSDMETTESSDVYTADDVRYGLDKHKADAKNSRRKMDKPRKRKRDIEAGVESATENGTLSDFWVSRDQHKQHRDTAR